ncbi:fatty-acid amide hydrolase 2-B [Ixodes scapularis]|uniref:fatty-acid amide hydrolase 2-B n=1 Tax=Ixodes scapularis TaxID=6945 RepID=UPI001C38D3F5|nr:fatty-acid amide hydrolase 2-B [Ixodes scapularis]XP_042147592.1 fatty-acid amide hydrolase 2-B [Ixodes scapularis]
MAVEAVRTAGVFLAELLLRWMDLVTDLLLFLVNLCKRRRSVPPIRDPLLLQSATALAANIRQGKVSSVDAVRAYASRVSQVDPLLNAVVDERFQDALADAQRADDLARSGALSQDELARTKPLLGVPFIVKNSVSVKGLICDVGVPAWRGHRGDRDCEVVSLLRQAGAIPVATTNTPQLCLWTESFNRIYGRTNNPHDTRRTCGGSSGGEGSLLSAAGALLGVGTDIGGSIRLPSFYCGTFGHMTTPGIVSSEGHRHPFSSKFMRLYSAGPMTRYACDLAPMLKAMLPPGARDKLDLDAQVDLKKIRMFYVEDEGCRFFSRVHADVTTSVQRVASHFHEVHGISTERITIEAMACGFEMWLSLLAVSEGDPPTAAFTNADGSPINPWLEMLKSAIGRSAHSFPALMVTILVNHLMPKPDSSYVRRYTTMAAELRARLQSLLGDDGVLVCPTALEPAPFHNAHALRPGAVTLTAPVNIAGLPATACPVGPTRAGDRPVGVQVVAGPYRDRLCLAVASEIERAFGGWQRPCEVRCDGS